MFYKTVPKFGTEVVKRKRVSTTNGDPGSEGGKRVCAEEYSAVSTLAGRMSISSRATTSASALLTDTDPHDDFFTSADAKLRYLASIKAATQRASSAMQPVALAPPSTATVSAAKSSAKKVAPSSSAKVSFANTSTYVSTTKAIASPATVSTTSKSAAKLPKEKKAIAIILRASYWSITSITTMLVLG